MKKKFVRWFFNRFKVDIYDLMVVDFFGDVPNDLKEPSIEFLAQGKQTLEKFFSITAYWIQRRSIHDKKNAQFYDGSLVIIKAMLHAIRNVPQKKVVHSNDTPNNEPENPKTALEKISEFAELAMKMGKTDN